jgi:hypothetical protein
MTPLEACRQQVAAFLHEPLALPLQVEQLFSETRLVSDAFAAFYLECRLSPPGAELDFLAGASHARARQLEAPPAEAFGNDPVSVYISKWLEDRSELRAGFVWLERDDLPGAGHRPTGNVHVCVDGAYRRRTSRDDGREETEFDASRALQIVLDMQQHSLLAEHQVETLRAHLERLPAGGRLIHVSAMLARTPAELKLYLALPTASLPDYLARMGFEEPCKALLPWATVDLNGPIVYCDLTFRGKVGRRAGLVFSQQQLPDLPGDPSRQELRTRMVREGLCTLAQDAALEAWLASPIDPPSELDSRYRVRRWLDLKLTAGDRLSSKAYLGFAALRSLF